MPCPRFRRSVLVMLTSLAGLWLYPDGRVLAQNVAPDDRPTLLVPTRPPTQKEIDRRGEALSSMSSACCWSRRIIS